MDYKAWRFDEKYENRKRLHAELLLHFGVDIEGLGHLGSWKNVNMRGGRLYVACIPGVIKSPGVIVSSRPMRISR